jgi:hypothetical protein
MIITRYKPLFSFTALYQLAGIGITADGLTMDAPTLTMNAMNDFKLKPRFQDNNVTVFFEGKETPPDAPVTSEPSVLINTNEYFYFTINFSDKEKISGLKFHSTDAIAKAIGFPVLYNALIPANATPPGVSIQEDVKIISPVFTFTVTQSQSGLGSEYAALKITDEKNATVDLNIPLAALNDKSIDGVSAVPEFAFSIDASGLAPGIYKFKVGNYVQKFFIANNMDVLNSVSLIRVLKNTFLGYNKNLADDSFAEFELLIPKA